MRSPNAKALRQSVVALLVTVLAAGCGNDDNNVDSGSEPSTTETESTTTETETETGDCSNEPTQEAVVDCVLARVLVDGAAQGARPPESNVEAANPYPYTVEEYLNFIVQDVDQMWSPWFAEAGLAEPYIGTEIVLPNDQPFVSNCTLGGNKVIAAHDYPNAFYCSYDSMSSAGVTYKGMLVLPVTTFQKMWTGDILGDQSKQVGDFAAAIVVAHEMGHHVQDEIWTQAGETTGQTIPDPSGHNKENIADCFAGVWMASAYYSGVLEPGDFDEGVAALDALGAEFSATHGTPEERVEALLLGYHGQPGVTEPGDPVACINAYGS